MSVCMTGLVSGRPCMYLFIVEHVECFLTPVLRRHMVHAMCLHKIWQLRESAQRACPVFPLLLQTLKNKALSSLSCNWQFFAEATITLLFVIHKRPVPVSRDPLLHGLHSRYADRTQGSYASTRVEGALVLWPMWAILRYMFSGFQRQPSVGHYKSHRVSTDLGCMTEPNSMPLYLPLRARGRWDFCDLMYGPVFYFFFLFSSMSLT